MLKCSHHRVWGSAFTTANAHTSFLVFLRTVFSWGIAIFASPDYSPLYLRPTSSSSAFLLCSLVHLKDSELSESCRAASQIQQSTPPHLGLLPSHQALSLGRVCATLSQTLIFSLQSCSLILIISQRDAQCPFSRQMSLWPSIHQSIIH